MTRGRGTPAPFDPPKVFVASGPEPYVRNPMYVGAVLALMGGGLAARSASVVALGVAFWLLSHVLVVLVEEPDLVKRFGDLYAEVQAAGEPVGSTRPARGVGTTPLPMTSAATALRRVKLLHTAIWAFFAGCVVAIPVLALAGPLQGAVLSIAAVSVEVAILALNRWRCPLTAIAARYTDDRRANFDIYLPVWLARYNKEVFGSLFGAGVVLTIMRAVGWLA